MIREEEIKNVIRQRKKQRKRNNMDYKEFFKEYGDQNLMCHNVPGCGHSFDEINVEDLYQAFRERLLAEITSYGAFVAYRGIWGINKPQKQEFPKKPKPPVDRLIREDSQPPE